MQELPPPDYRGYRSPPEIIAPAVWRYCRFALSCRDVEAPSAERGVVVTDESIRRRCRTCGQGYTDALRRRRPRPGDTWHLDEVSIRIDGAPPVGCLAVDPDGSVLDIRVQSRRDPAAARESPRELLEGLLYVPRVPSTDKRASYGTAHRVLLPSVDHRRHRGLDNRAENAPPPTRERERRRRRFSRRGTPGASWPPTARSPPLTASAATTPSPPGARSPAAPLPPDPQVGPG